MYVFQKTENQIYTKDRVTMKSTGNKIARYFAAVTVVRKNNTVNPRLSEQKIFKHTKGVFLQNYSAGQKNKPPKF